MRSMLALTFVLTACGQEPAGKSRPAQTEFTMCEAEAEGVCVIEYSAHMKIDYARLSRYFAMMEYEVNYYYPGLYFATVAADLEFDMIFEWAGTSTIHKGEYNDQLTEAYVYLRRGENITPKMECTDRYLVAMHEALHFVVSRFLRYEYAPGEDSHMVPHIFNRWAFFNDASVDDGVEGRMNSWISRDCFEE